MSRLEDRLKAALDATGDHVEPAEDLFARVRSGIDADRHRRQARRRALKVAGVGCVLATIAALFFNQAVFNQAVFNQGGSTMRWWMFEVMSFAALAVIALVLGPFIKRFGRSYAADVFRSNPATGKSFIVLTDFAYYLIFGAYILFTTHIVRPRNWTVDVGAEQVQNGIVRIGGILLIIGVLHGVNLLVLPIIGRLLTLNRRLDQQMREAASRDEQ